MVLEFVVKTSHVLVLLLVLALALVYELNVAAGEFFSMYHLQIMPIVLLIFDAIKTSSGNSACKNFSGPKVGTDSWQVYFLFVTLTFNAC